MLQNGSFFLSLHKYILICLVLVFFILAGVARAQQTATCPYTPSDQENLTERDVFILLYCATDGTGWESSINWLTDDPLGNWAGVEVDGGNVTELGLVNNRLTGEIPTEIGNLTNLTSLYLSSNELNGEMTTEPGDLAGPRYLYSYNNNFIYLT